MPEGFIIKTDETGQAQIVKAEGIEIADHQAKIWLDGDEICLVFPAIEGIKFAGHPTRQIVTHAVHLRADKSGITTAEALLYLRQQIMQKGKEGALYAFAENGTNRSAILELYKKMLG